VPKADYKLLKYSMKQTGDTSANFLHMIDNCKPIAYNHRIIY